MINWSLFHAISNDSITDELLSDFSDNPLHVVYQRSSAFAEIVLLKYAVNHATDKKLTLPPAIKTLVGEYASSLVNFWDQDHLKKTTEPDPSRPPRALGRPVRVEFGFGSVYSDALAAAKSARLLDTSASRYKMEAWLLAEVEGIDDDLAKKMMVAFGLDPAMLERLGKTPQQVTAPTPTKKTTLSDAALEAKAAAKFLGLRALTGTPKQRQWAEQLRAKRIAHYEIDLIEKIAMIEKCASSGFWIDNRDSADYDFQRNLILLWSAQNEKNRVAGIIKANEVLRDVCDSKQKLESTIICIQKITAVIDQDSQSKHRPLLEQALKEQQALEQYLMSFIDSPSDAKIKTVREQKVVAGQTWNNVRDLIKKELAAADTPVVLEPQDD